MLNLTRIVLKTRAVSVGLVVAAISIVFAIGWAVFGQPDPCAGMVHLFDIVAEHRAALYGVLVIWSFFLFLTVLPLGTVTVLIAGLLLGPLAGVAQFVSLFIASAVLYEVGRERDPEKLGNDLAAYPKLMALAGLARRRGFLFTCAMRVAPVLPSAASCLGASFFNVSRLKFYGGTLATGWIRPVAFAALASAGRMMPFCAV